MDARRHRHVQLRLQVPPHHHGRSAHRHVLTLTALLLSGCTLPLGSDLEAASITTKGRFELGDGLLLEAANLTAAPRDQPALGTKERPVELGPDAKAQTRLRRDEWVFRVELREVRPGSAEGLHRATLEWNGEARPPIHVQQRAWSKDPERVVLLFGLGARLENSSLYVLRVEPTS